MENTNKEKIEVKDNLLKELKEIEDKKNKIDETLKDLNSFSNKLKESLMQEEKNIEDKKNKILIQKEKLKNENELDLLTENNEKLEKYLALLSKQYELEIKYIQQYCDHKSKIEKISEKYSHINFTDILPLEKLYIDQLQKINKKSSILENSSNNIKVKESLEYKPPPPPPPNDEDKNTQKRNSISNIVNNPIIKQNKNDIRTNGSLQDHLKNALNTKYRALRNDDSEQEENSDFD